jgi:hypothetical protein
MPMNGKYEMPSGEPFGKDGKPNFNADGLDKEGLMWLIKAYHFAKEKRMEPTRGVWRPPFDMKSG